MARDFQLLALLASMLVLGAASPNQIIEANAEQFHALKALIQRAGLEDTFKDESLSYTFFLPLDHAFTWFKEYLPSLGQTNITHIVQVIEAADVAKAKQFLEQHIIPQPIRNVDALLKDEEIKSANDMVITITGDAGYINVMEPDGYSGTVAGPAVFPAGNSYVYVLSDGMMGDPALIVGHGPLDLEEDAEDEFDVMFEEEPAEAGTTTTAPPPSPEEDDRTEL